MGWNIEDNEGIFREKESFERRDRAVRELLRVDRSFDLIRRPVRIGGKKACWYTVDGLLNGELMEKVMDFYLGITPEDMPGDMQGFMEAQMPYVDAAVAEDVNALIQAFFSGNSCLLIDGYAQILTMDLRDYPARSIQEPIKDKVLQGSRDGLTETIMANIALIRRRIRDPELTFELANVGMSSRTDVAVVYMQGRTPDKVLRQVRRRLRDIRVDALSLNQQSLAEALMPRAWWNPMPKFKYTERPDTTAACLLEGSVVILVDNSPNAMIIPSSLFDIIEDPNDYYLPPVTGTYLRLSRMFINICSIFLIPLFLLFLQHPQWVPQWLEFIMIEDEVNVPPLLQLLILEIAIDGLKMASVNTPSMLSTPLSVVAGIVFGDYTVKSGWFNSEIMLYMAVVAVANYTQSNMELGYAIKFLRIQLLLWTAVLGLPGFVIGCLFAGVSVVGNPTFTGRNYLYPLIPFNGRQLLKRFFRVSLMTSEKWSER